MFRSYSSRRLQASSSSTQSYRRRQQLQKLEPYIIRTSHGIDIAHLIAHDFSAFDEILAPYYEIFRDFGGKSDDVISVSRTVKLGTMVSSKTISILSRHLPIQSFEIRKYYGIHDYDYRIYKCTILFPLDALIFYDLVPDAPIYFVSVMLSTYAQEGKVLAIHPDTVKKFYGFSTFSDALHLIDAFAATQTFDFLMKEKYGSGLKDYFYLKSIDMQPKKETQ